MVQHHSPQTKLLSVMTDENTGNIRNFYYCLVDDNNVRHGYRKNDVSLETYVNKEFDEEAPEIVIQIEKSINHDEAEDLKKKVNDEFVSKLGYRGISPYRYKYDIREFHDTESLEQLFIDTVGGDVEYFKKTKGLNGSIKYKLIEKPVSNTTIEERNLNVNPIMTKAEIQGICNLMYMHPFVSGIGIISLLLWLFNR